MKQDPVPQPLPPELQSARPGPISRALRPFRTATLRGLAIILPPLLTILFFIWAWNVIESYVLSPVESALTELIVYYTSEVYDDPTDAPQGEALTQVPTGKWIPAHVHATAEQASSGQSLNTPADYYRLYVKSVHLQRHLFIPAFLALFIFVLYLLGKLLAAGLGRFVLHYFENLITRLPIIRNVYSSVKQVTDFALNENEMTFTRIVAVEYPRKGIWSMGFVTGEGMKDIRTAAGEPILSVLMPTSPMPATGFTISVPKSETIDLNITIDQAVQFCVSCGVVIPLHQQNRSIVEGEVRSQFSQIAANGDVAVQPGNGTTAIGDTSAGSSPDNVPSS